MYIFECGTMQGMFAIRNCQVIREVVDWVAFFRTIDVLLRANLRRLHMYVQSTDLDTIKGSSAFYEYVHIVFFEVNVFPLVPENTRMKSRTYDNSRMSCEL